MAVQSNEPWHHILMVKIENYDIWNLLPVDWLVFNVNFSSVLAMICRGGILPDTLNVFTNGS
jgi:hypothetical protein